MRFCDFELRVRFCDFELRVRFCDFELRVRFCGIVESGVESASFCDFVESMRHFALKKFISLVFPGVDELFAKFLLSKSALISEDLPTLLRPKIAISAPKMLGAVENFSHERTKCALITFIIFFHLENDFGGFAFCACDI